MKKREWDVVRAKQLYDEGLDDLSIADMVGATEGAIKAWRARNRLKANAAPVRGKRAAAPTSDSAPTLTGSNWKPIALFHPEPETVQTVPPPRDIFHPCCSSNQRATDPARGSSGTSSAGCADSHAVHVAPNGALFIYWLLQDLHHRRRSRHRFTAGFCSLSRCGASA